MQRTEINPAPTFRVPRAKGLNRPSTWFSKSSASASTSSSSSSSSSTPTINNTAFASTSGAASPSHNPFANPNVVFSTKGKHRLSPSPSPHALRQDEDFVMISPVRPSITGIGRDGSSSGSGSSPIEDSPTPACGMASATARLKLGDDDSPIRRIPGQSRSLRAGPSLFVQTTKATPASPLKYSTNALALSDGETSPQLPETPLGECLPPQPLFPLRSSQSQECASSKAVFTTSNGSKSIRIDDRPRMTAPHPTRARSSTDAEQRIPMLGQKKAISLDAIPLSVDKDETFGSSLALNTGKKNRPSSSAIGSRDGRAHKRINSSEYRNPASISRSFGLKSGLALSLSPGLPDFSSSNSSLSSLSTNNMTPPASAFSPAEPPIFEDVKPLQEAFEQPTGTVSRKFKPRDSGVSMGGNDDRIPPPSVLKVNTNVRPRRPAMLKRTSSMGDEFRQDCETPGIGPAMEAAWPGPGAFDFLGDGALAIGMGSNDGKISMPGTPVKKQAFTTHRGMGHSHSQPTLASDAFDADDKVPPSTQKLPPSVRRATAIPHLTLTTTSSPDSPNAMDTDHSSPTVHLGNPMLGASEENKATRVGMLRPNNGASETSEDEGTPTKGGGERLSLAMGSQVTPTPSPRSALKTKPNFANLPISTPHLGGPIMPRLSLPAFAAPKLHRTLHHRQSHPAPATLAAEEDVFERRFITLETLGKGAFSTVVKVQERYGEGLWAVKKARGVFDGVRDRLRHLEEVDILRHLSKTPCDHVVQFEDAWEQNRQLFIQTELCLGSLAFFLEEYGRVVERLDEGRVWKIVRELSDGINHIHSNGVIHFDIKPANILISSTGSLKIGDFGLATRWPRVDPIEILKGSGLGGSAIHMSQSTVGTQAGRLEREGDRDYMPPEMLRGVFVMAADIFSFGLVILEVSTNICVPDGGAPWHALRGDDFSVVDLSPLSPALVDLITSCMRASPDQRPRIGHVVSHPVVQRARRRGKNALAPEDPRWLVDILSGGSGMSDEFGQVGDGDVEMLDS